jgi:hypothetical protein
MSKTLAMEEHVLPRAVERLPDYAATQARRTASEKFVDAFGLSQSAATAIANAVVDPSAVRKSIGEPADPDVERIAVPGGTLLGIRTAVWARRVMPDPRNPRTLPSRRHPFAVDSGMGGEDSKFRPVPEPRSPDSIASNVAELVVDIESRDHLNWAVQHAATYVLAENDWRTSIASQGVMGRLACCDDVRTGRRQRCRDNADDGRRFFTHDRRPQAAPNSVGGRPVRHQRCGTAGSHSQTQCDPRKWTYRRGSRCAALRAGAGSHPCCIPAAR